MTAAQLEVVARAIYLAFGDDPDVLVVRSPLRLTGMYPSSALPKWQHYCYAARCAIEAMQKHAVTTADVDPLGR